MDDDGSKSLNLMEFKKALKEMNLKLTDMQIMELFAYFDTDKSGTIDFDEFLVGVRVIFRFLFYCNILFSTNVVDF